MIFPRASDPLGWLVSLVYRRTIPVVLAMFAAALTLVFWQVRMSLERTDSEPGDEFLLLGAAGLCGGVGLAIVVRKLQRTAEDLEAGVRLRMADLEDNRVALAERVQLLALGSDVSAALAHGAGMQDMLQQCAAAIVRHLDASFARIWIISDAGDVLELQASAGMYTHLDGAHGRIPVGKYKIGMIAQQREPHLTNQVDGDPRVSDQEWARREGMVSFAGHPLVVEGRLLGVVAMFARHSLSDATSSALESAADTIAVGIDRRRQEEARERAESQMRLAVEAAPNGMVMINPRGAISLVNTRMAEMFGHEQQDLLGQPIEMLLPDQVRTGRGERFRPFFQDPDTRTAEEGQVLFGVRRDGSQFPVEVRLNPIETEEGRLMLAAVVDITRRKRAEQKIADVVEELKQTAHYDALTGLLNRHSFDQQLEGEWSRAARADSPFSCVLLDADYFKSINDEFGHAAGDEVLRKIAEILQNCCRGSDCVARYGGEEFCVLLPDTDQKNAARWAELVRQRIADEVFLVEGFEIRATASLGVAQRLPDVEAPAELVRRADEALRLAKQLGRNQVVGFGHTQGAATSGENLPQEVFSGMCAGEVMTPLIVCLRESHSIQQALELLLRTRLESLPVVDGDGRLIGVMAEEDLTVRLLAGDTCRGEVREKMNRRMVCFPEDTLVQDVYEFLRRAAIRRIVVVDGLQRPVGIISRATILRWLGNAAGVFGSLSAPQPAGLNDLPSAGQRLALACNQLDEQVTNLRRQLDAESNEVAVSIIGGVTRIQEILDEALAHAGEDLDSQAATAPGRDLLA